MDNHCYNCTDVLLCVMPQVDRCVNFSQQSVAVKAGSPKSSQMSCKCIQIIWPVQTVSRSNLLFLCACSVDRAVSSTAQQLFLPQKTQSMMGDAVRPAFSWKSVGFALTDIPF